MDAKRISVPLEYSGHIKSLCWQGNKLIDIVGGFSTIDLEGNVLEPKIIFAYRFDGAIVSPDGIYSVVFERYGTKALLLRGNKILRELNRSYYCADVYEFPIAFLQLAPGEWGIVYCPDDYNVIEIESADTGQRVTKPDRESVDFFHSRLATSPKSRWLLSAGWIWHPLDSIMLFDLSGGLMDPAAYSSHWESNGLGDVGLWEISEAAFLSDNELLVSGSGDQEHEDRSDGKSVAVYDLTERRIVSRKELSEPTGEIMPIGSDLAVTFYRHPKLLNFRTGKIEHEWEDIETDSRNGSISFHERKAVIATDRVSNRFAVLTPNSIEVISLSL